MGRARRMNEKVNRNATDGKGRSYMKKRRKRGKKE
jgi:hypothetical protein